MIHNTEIPVHHTAYVFLSVPNKWSEDPADVSVDPFFVHASGMCFKNVGLFSCPYWRRTPLPKPHTVLIGDVVNRTAAQKDAAPALTSALSCRNDNAAPKNEDTDGRHAHEQHQPQQEEHRTFHIACKSSPDPVVVFSWTAAENIACVLRDDYGVTRLEMSAHYARLLTPTMRALFYTLPKHGIEVVYLESIYRSLIEIRFVKTPLEIQNIREACRITCHAIQELWHMVAKKKPTTLRTMYEFVESTAKTCVLPEDGVKPLAHATILTTGGAATGVNITPNEFVDVDLGTDAEHGNPEPILLLLDIAVRYRHYCCGVTRTFPHAGTWTDEQMRLYEIVREMHEEAVKMICPGIRFDELERATRRRMYARLVQEGIHTVKTHDGHPVESVEDIVAEQATYAYMPHAIGHSIGIEMHDCTPTPFVLQTGCVLVIKPAIYLAHTSIRIEDTVLVTDTGHEILSHELPITREGISAQLLCAVERKTKK